MPLLCDLIDLPTSPLIAITGAGGKTTTMYTLASELALRGKRVITTTTTQIFYPEPDETDTLIVAAETPELLKTIDEAWQQYHRLTIAGTVLRTEKLAGLQPEQPFELLVKSGADVVIVEADGARHRMIKAPAEHEPVIPLQTNVALLMMSAEAINQPLSDRIAHRPERVAQVTGINEGDVLSPAVIARLITSEQGAFKHIPETATAYLLITHASIIHKATVRELVSLVRRSTRITGVLISEQPSEWVAV
ncbi:MAG TPA: selenium cofactor biosynthesis protein YqeC [Ktedonobacteraceae bacterium]